MTTEALLHLHILMTQQGRTEDVELKNSCPRCQEIMAALTKEES